MRTSRRFRRNGEHEATELRLYVENEGPLYGQRQAIEKALRKKLKSGKYDHSKAWKLWMYWVDAGAKKYAKEFSVGADWSKIFDKKTRESVAKDFSDDFKAQGLHMTPNRRSSRRRTSRGRR